MNGIIDESRNPFGANRSSWIEQEMGLTEHRKNQLLDLLNLGIDKIMDAEIENENRYVAFVAVRWGFAKIMDGKLRKTEKLERWNDYDERGELK